jgi:hypothetical protein
MGHWQRAARSSALCAAVALAGCANEPSLPPSFSPSQVAFVAAPEATALLAESGSRTQGAWHGVRWGLPIGLVLGAFYRPDEGSCLLWVCRAYLVRGALLGTVAGVIIGVLTAAPSAETLARREWLAAAWSARPYAQQLVAALRARTPARDPAAAGSTATVAIDALEFDGQGSGGPYALRLEARLVVTPTVDPAAATTLFFTARSSAERTDADWRADGAAPLALGLDECVQSLADQMLYRMQRSAGRQAAAMPG